MIDIGKILKRSWHILWSYRILWIFGLLLVLTGGGSNGGARGGSSNSGYQFNGNNGNNGYNGVFPSTNPIVEQLNQWFQQNLEPLVQYPAQHIGTIVLIGAGIVLFFLIIGLALALVRCPAETALIRMVDGYEETGEKVKFREGWKLGWNRRAFRIWVIELILRLPAIVFFAFLAGLGLLVFISVRNAPGVGVAAGVIAGIGCAFLFMFAFIIFMVVLGLLRQFFIRAAALENAGIGESFQRGWAMFKRNWKSAGLMWLVMLGIGIAAAIAGLIVFFVLIPTYVVMAIPAVVVAAVPGLLAFGITSIFASGPLAWILGILAALPFFFLVVFLPLAFVSGWYTIYHSSVWTLTYREMKALESVNPALESVPPTVESAPPTV